MFFCNYVTVIICLVASCVLCSVGTPLPWVYFPKPFSDACVTLWGAKYDCTKDKYTVEWKDVDCEIRDYMLSAQSFALVSCIASGVSAGLSLILMIMKVRRLPSGLLCFISFGMCLITVALFVYPFTQKICGFPYIGIEFPSPPNPFTPAPPNAEDYGNMIGPGFAMFIAAVVVNFVAFLIMLFGGCCCSSSDPSK